MCVPPHRNSIGKSALGHKGVIKRAGPGSSITKSPLRFPDAGAQAFQPVLAVVVMRGAAVVGNNAVMTGEGQVVQLDVRIEDDALSDGIHRSATVERLGRPALPARQSLVRVLQVVLNDVRLASRLRDEIGSQRAAAVLPAFGELETTAKRGQIGVAKVRIHDL